jgi:hypothetical protein
MKSQVTIVLATALTLLSLAGLAGAGPLARLNLQGGAPTVVSYQGQVMVDGDAYDGTGDFKFAIVNAAGDTTYWSNDGTSAAGGEPTNAVQLVVTDGLFNTLLGDTTLGGMTQALGAAVFSGTDRTLRVWFSQAGAAGTFTQLIPDRRIAAVPYALQAQEANNADLLDGQHASELAVPSGAMVLGAPSDSRLTDVGYSDLGPSNVTYLAWQLMGAANTPTAREHHTAVWTEREMLVWGGRGSTKTASIFLNTGGRYDPATDTWTDISITNAPHGRWGHTAVWTGSEMLVWGGWDATSYFNDGGRYNGRDNVFLHLYQKP